MLITFEVPTRPLEISHEHSQSQVQPLINQNRDQPQAHDQDPTFIDRLPPTLLTLTSLLIKSTP